MSERINTYTQSGGEVMLQDETFPREAECEIRIYGHVQPLYRADGTWRTRPKVGDVAVINGKSGMEHHFRFIDVEHCTDPQEMYFGTVKRFKVIEDGEVIWEADPVPAEVPGLLSRLVALVTRKNAA